MVVCLACAGLSRLRAGQTCRCCARRGRGEPRLVLALAVDDPAAAEVVRRNLDLHAVAGIDADPVAPHLAGGVAEGLVAVVERDLVHAVAEGLDDLALELDLLLFPCHVHLLPELAPAPLWR